MEDKQINIVQIMNEIRNDIKEKGYINNLVEFDDIYVGNDTDMIYDAAYYNEILSRLNSNCNVIWYRDLHCSGVKKLIKKCIRKALTFLIKPMAEEQSIQNAETVKAFGQIGAYMRQKNELLELYKNRMNELEQKVAELEKKIGESGR